jgi:hypothetical protein
MRRIAVVVALVLAVCTTAFGQNPVGFGVKGGVNVPSIPGVNQILTSTPGTVTTETLSVPVAGAFIEAPVSRNVSIQPEVLYSVKGAKFTETVDSSLVTTTAKVDYLAFPVLARFNVSPQRRTNAYAIGGFELAIRLRTRLEGKTDTGEAVIDTLDRDIKRLDYGIAVGGGIEFRPFMAEARYTFGLVNVATAANANVKNRVFSVMGGVRF